MKSRTFAAGLLIGAALAFPATLSAQAPAGGAPRGGGVGLSPKESARMAAIPTFPDNPGHGAFKVDYEAAPAPVRAVVYHPIDIKAATAKRKLGVYVWGNGGCTGDAAQARIHLAEIASAGYVAVAPGSILSGAKAPPRDPAPPPAPGVAPAAGARGAMPRGPGVTPADMTAALDWILAENARAGSPYYQKLDANRVAIGGNSCGGLLAIKMALDPRVKEVAVQNSGVFNAPAAPGPAAPAAGAASSPMNTVTKADLAKLHTPILYVLGGEHDVAYPNGMDDFQKISHVPVFVADRTGANHIGVFLEPTNNTGTFVELDWLAWRLDGDKNAAKTFVGKDCKLCVDPKWKVYKKKID